MKHLFAVYVPSLDVPPPYAFGSDLLHRCKNVLRLKPGQQVIIFDNSHQSLATIQEYQKKSITVLLEDKVPLVGLKPEIHWLLPLLKREAFEHSLYSLCEMGATSIYPVVTAKTCRSWGSEKEYARAQTIMIAAAEQAKQFVVPKIHPVTELLQWHQEGDKIFFDPEGVPLRQMLVDASFNGPLYGCVGPEGDLTIEEKAYLKEQGFLLCALTPTVLRARQAVALGVGIVRSYFIDLPSGVE